MSREAQRASIIGIILNTFLFILKLIAGLLSHSFALISDALNSFTDIISSSFIFFMVGLSAKKSDDSHPFGHRRFEPIGGILVAMLAAVLAIEIIKSAITALLTHEKSLEITPFTFAVVIICIVVKVGMYFYFRNVGTKARSPSIIASTVDYRNDILASSLVIIALIGAWLGFPLLDDVIAIIIGIFIFYSGYRIGMENIDYLVGKAPPAELLHKIEKKALSVRGILGIHDVRAQLAGNNVQVEIHIDVNRNLTLVKAHELGKKVQAAVRELPEVDEVFTHIDPKH